MLKELTSRGILFICLRKGEELYLLYLDAKKIYSTIPLVHSTVYTLPHLYG